MTEMKSFTNFISDLSTTTLYDQLAKERIIMKYELHFCPACESSMMFLDGRLDGEIDGEIGGSFYCEKCDTNWIE